MRHRLTESAVGKFPAPASGNRLYYDQHESGFALRVTANGARSYVVCYRTREGKDRRYTIGPTDKWSTTKAREKARQVKTGVSAGVDPLEELRKERTASTVAEMVTRYAEEHLPKKRKRSQIEDMRLFPIILDALGRKKIKDVTDAEIASLHRKLTRERGPFRANRALALLSKMFALSVRPWRLRSDNPCKGIEKNPEPKRNRYLSDEEMPRLAAALAAEEDKQAVDIIWLLLLTGARSAEVLNATWSQFDLRAGVWIKPHTATKQKEEHRLPLAEQAVELLAALRKEASEKALYVFPAPDSVLKPRLSVRHAWDRVRAAAGLDEMRLHDLRHSHASFLVNAGYSLPVIGAMLGHKTPQTTQRYIHLADKTLREAAKAVGAKVVPIKSGV